MDDDREEESDETDKKRGQRGKLIERNLPPWATISYGKLINGYKKNQNYKIF